MMRDTSKTSVITAAAVLAISAFFDTANAGVAVTGPHYGGYDGYYYDYPYTYGYAPWAYGYYYPHGYWHPPAGYYFPRAYRRQYNRTLYRGYM
jgi:hypothetical protein